ncbi:MAG TPA: aspartate-semialdehyde dehydrogenase [Sphingobacterium sp.]|nr:aspartate-semialdehyde dehydrogenase [Sphingobacterium sp.]
MKIAVVGATGLVGSEIIKVLEERDFPVTELLPVASARSKGKEVAFKGKKYKIVTLDEAVTLKPDLAIFSAGGSVSKEYAEKFAKAGTKVVDNSSAWRMDPAIKLVVPEVNGNALTKEDEIIANPNCSTTQMVLVLKPLHDRYKIKRVVVSTYQSITGTGVKAVEQMENERAGIKGEMAYPYPIDKNILPHIDDFQENGYTKEEMKMINETKKILDDYSIELTATTVRIPVVGGHAESINIEFEKDFDVDEVRSLLATQEGVVIKDNPTRLEYPMPIDSHGRDEVFVGRIRRDESQANTLNLWVVADNLRKGAATNSVQIAEYLFKNDLI